MARIERPYFYTAVDLDFCPLGPYDEMQHITVTPPMTEQSDQPLDVVVEALQKRARRIGSITVAIANLAMFGPDHSIAVRTIADPSGLLMYTHGRMLDVLSEHGYSADTTYTGLNYHPHTTLIPGRPEPHGIVHVDALVVSRSTAPGSKEVYAHIPLHAE